MDAEQAAWEVSSGVTPGTTRSVERDDSELMREVSAGSVEAFGQVYDRFCQRAYRVAYSVCRDEVIAQDVVQEAFLTLWRNRTNYRPERGPVGGWLLTVVRRRALDVAEPAAAHETAATAPGRDRADRLRAAMAQLPEEQQEVITLAYHGRLSHHEIAAQLGLSSAIVKSRMRLGLQGLRTLADDGAPSDQTSL